MDSPLRQFLRARAEDRCEYCHIRQDDDPFFRFHIEHIIARQHGGATIETNLALACHHCNLHKGPNLSGVDPDTDSIATLFNPRTQIWGDHFFVADSQIIGKTPSGRATVELLKMNAIGRRKLRISDG